MWKPNTSSEKSGGREWLRWTVMAWAFTVPISIALAEIFAYLLLLILFYRAPSAIRRMERPERLLGLAVLLFIAGSLYASITGLTPAYSLHKSHRLLFMLLPLSAVLFHADMEERPSLVKTLIAAFIAGCVLLGVYDLLRISWGISQGVETIYDLGNMRDPQFYMVALLLAVACRRAPWLSVKSGWLFRCIVMILLAALILHFKRGAWMACAAGFVLYALQTRQWKFLGLLCVAGGGLVLLPPVQERLLHVHELIGVQAGGRWTLWLHIAPELISDFPGGIGYRAMTHELLLSYSRHLQPHLNHLHNNVLQVLAENGWHGLAFWVVYMAVFFRYLLLIQRVLCTEETSGVAAGLLIGAVALFINGLFEYNFGDTEIILLWNLLGVIMIRYRFAMQGVRVYSA